MGSIAQHLAAVNEELTSAASTAGRPPPLLVAVSKGHDAAAIREAYAAGQRDFGENYVQELVGKAAALADLNDLRWHFIGHLQRNKVKDVVGLARVIHTVDRADLAREIDKRASSTLRVLLEVNVAGEAQKSGCAPSDVGALAEAVRALPRLELAGLMTVPPFEEDAEATRPHFAALRRAAEDLAERGLLPARFELSMGMSHDAAIAVAEGATIVRVGTAIFGERAKKPSGPAGDACSWGSQRPAA